MKGKVDFEGFMNSQCKDRRNNSKHFDRFRQFAALISSSTLLFVFIIIIIVVSVIVIIIIVLVDVRIVVVVDIAFTNFILLPYSSLFLFSLPLLLLLLLVICFSFSWYLRSTQAVCAVPDRRNLVPKVFLMNCACNSTVHCSHTNRAGSPWELPGRYNRSVGLFNENVVKSFEKNKWFVHQKHYETS